MTAATRRRRTNFRASLDCSTKVLEERYGTWDLFNQVEAVNALTIATKHKASAVQLMEDGHIAA